MSEPLTTKVTHEEMRQFVIFQLGTESFCIDLIAVREIIRIGEITRIPESPAFVEGVITLRGEVVAVVDLRKRFGFQIAADVNKANRIMIIEAGQHVLGFIVDEVREVLRIETSAIKPPPAMITSEVDRRYFEGVIAGKDALLIVLIAGLLFDQEELASVKQIERI